MGQITNFPNTVNVGILSIADVEVTATAAQINGTAVGSVTSRTASTLAVTSAMAGTTNVLNRAAGIAVTLPAATGSGLALRFLIGTTVTSNTTTIAVTGNDVFQGTCSQFADGGTTVNSYEAAGANRITMDGSTRGGIIGDSIELIDMAADTWFVRIVQSATGTEATPFSTV